MFHQNHSFILALFGLFLQEMQAKKLQSELCGYGETKRESVAGNSNREIFLNCAYHLYFALYQSYPPQQLQVLWRGNVPCRDIWLFLIPHRNIIDQDSQKILELKKIHNLYNIILHYNVWDFVYLRTVCSLKFQKRFKSTRFQFFRAERLIKAGEAMKKNSKNVDC